MRDVQSRLEEKARRPLSHSSVITILNIMVRKGYLKHRKEGKAFFFSPKVEKDEVSRRLVGDLLGRVFEGSATAMVLNLIESADLDADELASLRQLMRRRRGQVMILPFFGDPLLSSRLCLTLLHSLWQAALLIGIALAMGRLARRRSVEREYAFLVTALLTTLGTMPVTFALLVDGENGSDASPIVINRPPAGSSQTLVSSAHDPVPPDTVPRDTAADNNTLSPAHSSAGPTHAIPGTAGWRTALDAGFAVDCRSLRPGGRRDAGPTFARRAEPRVGWAVRERFCVRAPLSSSSARWRPNGPCTPCPAWCEWTRL